MPINTSWENTLAWHYDPKGLFSFKCAYKVYRRIFVHKQQRNGGASRLIWLSTSSERHVEVEFGSASKNQTLPVVGGPQ
jgi:hypothetical protein